MNLVGAPTDKLRPAEALPHCGARLVSRGTERPFARLLASDDPAARGWASTIQDRYTFLQDAGTATKDDEA